MSYNNLKKSLIKLDKKYKLYTFEPIKKANMKNLTISLKIFSLLLISGILFIKCISDNNKENDLIKKKEGLKYPFH